MNRNARNEKKGVARLRTDHIYLGIVIGDHAVAMYLAHVDASRHLLTLRQRVALMTLGRSCTPSIPQIRAALQECWDGLGGERIEYYECFLCLPPWATTRIEATESIPIRPARCRLDRAFPRVSDADVLRAQEALCRHHTPPSRVVTRVLPLHYVLAGGRRVTDPRGEITPGFDLHAQLELADAGIARNLLDMLAAMRLRVDLMVSPQGAVDALLRGDEDSADSAVIEIGQRTTCLSFRQDGATIHVAQLPRGADEVLANTAERLRTDPHGLAACFEARRDWLLDATACGGKPLPLWPAPFNSALSVRQVHEALLREAGAHFESIGETLDAVRRERGLQPDRIFFVGDEPVVTDAVARVASSLHAGRCQILRSPWQRSGQEEVFTPGCTRMAGLLLLGALGTPAFQPFLSSYNRTPSDPAIRVLAEDGRVAWRRLATGGRTARTRLAAGWRSRVVPSARRAILRIMALFM